MVGASGISGCRNGPSATIFTLTLALVAVGLADRAASAPRACTAPGYHQFDFWLGEWTVFDTGKTTPVATATISPVQGGCGIREQYRGVDGGGGESLTMFDPAAGRWRQAWVSNRGQIVIIEGRRRDGAITLTGPEYGGAPGRLVRGRWAPITGGAVWEQAWRSSDHGRTWSPWFDIVFRPVKATGPAMPFAAVPSRLGETQRLSEAVGSLSSNTGAAPAGMTSMSPTVWR